MASSPLDEQTAGCKSPHNELMSLAMELASSCDIYVEVKMVPIDAIWLFSVLMKDIIFASHFHGSSPAYGIGYASEKH